MAKEIVQIDTIDDFPRLEFGQRVRVKDSKGTETYIGISLDDSCSPCCPGNELLHFYTTARREGVKNIRLIKYFIPTNPDNIYFERDRKLEGVIREEVITPESKLWVRTNPLLN